MPSFDLTRERWIQCQTHDGELLEASLGEVFEQAPNLRGLASESPIVDAAVRRLLLTILHRCFGPEDDVAWRELWDCSEFSVSAIHSYLDKWRERFDLFHSERPFFQIARLVEQTPNYEKGKKPARELIAEQSSYGSPRDLFQSRPEGDEVPLAAAQAARWLVAIQAFHPGGLLSRDAKNGDPTAAKSGLLCGSAVVTVKGKSLFETLLLNLVNYPTDFPSSSDDSPTWEQDVPSKYNVRACRGLLDWYTWQSRRIQLLANDSGEVEHFVLLAGTELKDGQVEDPMCAYKKVQKLGFLNVGFNPDRAIWRDSTVLYQVQRDDDIRPPRVVSKAVAPSRNLARSQQLQLQVEGQVPNKASIVLTRQETLPLPLELINRPELVGAVRTEVARCEEAHSKLRHALKVAFEEVLSLGNRRPDGNDVGNLVQGSRALAKYWAGMKPHFDEFIRTLPLDRARALLEFKKAMRAQAIRRYQAAVQDSSVQSRTLKGLVVGEGTLMRGLAACGLSHSELNPKDAQQETTP